MELGLHCDCTITTSHIVFVLNQSYVTPNTVSMVFILRVFSWLCFPEPERVVNFPILLILCTKSTVMHDCSVSVFF